MFVQRVESQVHGTRQRQRDSETENPLVGEVTVTLFASPDAVENVSVGVDADVDVGHDDLVLLGLLLVAEEGVRHPDLGGVRQRQVVQLAWEVAQ